MKDYVLVFTEGADLYNLEKQLQFFSEDKIIRVPSEENFSTLNYYLHEASKNNCKNFTFITSNENWAQLDEAMKSEYGSLIENIDVIKAGFRRKFSESDPAPVQSNIQQLKGENIPTAFANKLPPHVVVVMPFNLLNFNNLNSTNVDNIVNSLAKHKSTIVSGNKKFFAKKRFHPTIPSSSLAIYGNSTGANRGITADEAIGIARQRASNQSLFNELFSSGVLVDDDTEAPKTQAAMTEAKVKYGYNKNPQTADASSLSMVATQLQQMYGINASALNTVCNGKLKNVDLRDLGIEYTKEFHNPKNIKLDSNSNNYKNFKQWRNKQIPDEQCFIYQNILKAVGPENINAIFNIPNTNAQTQQQPDAKSSKAQFTVEKGFIDTILTQLGLFVPLTEADNAQQVEDVVFFVEPSIEPILKSETTKGRRQVWYSTIQGESAEHFNKNANILNKFKGVADSIKPIQELNEAEREKFENSDFETFIQDRQFSDADNYLCQILMLNQFNIQNNISIDARQFDSTIVNKIEVKAGWGNIGKLVSSALMLDALENDFGNTQVTWAIKGLRKAAKYASNADGYRDQVRDKHANTLAALTPNPEKIPHPSDEKYKKIGEDKYIKADARGTLESALKQGEIVSFNDLPFKWQKKFLDEYQQNVSKNMLLLNRHNQRTIDLKTRDEKRNNYFNIQAKQQADRTSREEKIKNAERVIQQCKFELEADTKQDGKLLSSQKKEQVRLLYNTASEFIKNVRNADKHDYRNSDRDNHGFESDGLNLDLYNQMMDGAQKLGIQDGTQRQISNQLSKEQAMSDKTQLIKNKKLQLSDIEKEQKALSNQMFAHPQYKELVSALIQNQ